MIQDTVLKSFMFIFFVGSLASCVTINVVPTVGPLDEAELSGSGNAKVLVLELSGILSSARPQGLFDRPNLTARVKEELTKATEDQAIKAIVLRINSPGGTVTASDILHHEIRHFKETRQIPIIVSMMDLATSGGYYVALAGDKIVAHPSSVTGSIGVIMMTLNSKGLLEKIGVQANAVTSGPKKDMGSPFRAMTNEERDIFQGVIDSFYDRFLSVVQEGRPDLPIDKIKHIADGRIYSAAQAKELGLVDQLGYLDDAVELAKREAGLPEAKVVTYRRPGGYKHNIYSKMSDDASGVRPLPRFDSVSLISLLHGGTPQFLYLWMP